VRGRVVTAVGLLGLLTLVGDAGAVLHLRAEERAERRAAAEEAEAAYRAGVTSVAARVSAARTPVLQAADTYYGDADGGVLYDVTVHGAVAGDLRAAGEALAALPPPAAMVGTHDALLGSLEQMRTVAEQTAAPVDEDIATELEAFRAAALAFDGAVRDGLGFEVPLVPAAELPAELVTRGAVLYVWGSACGRALDALDDDPELEIESDADLVRLAGLYEDQADHLQWAIEALLAQALPEADRTVLERDVHSPLRGAQPGADHLRAAAAALRERDVDRFLAALTDVDRVLGSLEKASQGLQAYGSEVCSVYFDAGLLLGDDTGQAQEDLAET